MRRGLLPLAAVLGFAALHVAISPSGRDLPGGRGYLESDPRVAAATRRVTATADTLRAYQFAADREAAAARLAALPAPTTPISVVADAGVPASLVNSLRDAMAADLEGVEPRVPLRIVFVLDSTPRREGIAHYVRPLAAGEPCTIVLHYGRIVGDPVYLRRPEWRRVSVCGFYARHGMPGAGMTRWLDATSGSAALVDSSRVGGEPQQREAVAGAAVMQLAPVIACASGVDAACFDALYPRIFRATPPAVGGAAPTQAWRHASIVWDDYPSNGLARLRQHLGPERFERIWTSELRPDSAYTAVTGEAFAAFARPYVQEYTAPRSRGPLQAGLPLALSLALMVGLGWWATARTPRMRS